MLPLEFTIKGPPVSVQTRNKQRLQSWKQNVRASAVAALPTGSVPFQGQVALVITYYYDGGAPDVDNIIKPIHDALKGVVFVDDTQVVETKSRKKSLDGSYKVRGVSSILLLAFASGNDFLHIKVTEAGLTEVLE